MPETKIARLLRRTLTVGDLINLLKRLPQDAAVLIASDYGDHSHTCQVMPINEVDKLVYKLVESSYSKSGVAVDTDERSDNDDIYADGVVVLNFE